MKKYDVVALGEVLIDFTLNGVSNQGNGMYEANPGGAPCNVLAMLQKLDRKTAFIGKVGEDSFGKLLIKVVGEQGISTENIIMDKDIPTTLAFVHTAEDGDRSFSFYRKPGADLMLRESDLQESLLMDTKIFHFGTLSMTEELVENATRKAINIAKSSGALLSFDPNFRPLLWDDFEKAKEKIWYGISQCDILKISDDEIEFITGEKDIDKGIAVIQSKYDVPLICASMGRAGSKAFYHDLVVSCDAFLQEGTIETTGAGDTFMGCVLHAVLSAGLEHMKEQDLKDMLVYANAAASLITTKKGALKVMPTKEEVAEFLQ